MSTTHNKNLNSLLNLLINCMYARSAPQILSIKDECNFLLLNFVIIGLCNSSANSLLDLISFLTANSFASAMAPDDDFHQKTYKPLKQDLFGIHNI